MTDQPIPQSPDQQATRVTEPHPAELPRVDTSSAPSFRQRVEGHPIGILLGVAVAAITATLAIVVPIAQLTVDNRVAALQEEIAQQQTVHTEEIAKLRTEVESVRRDAAQELQVERARSQARIDELDRSLSSIKRSLGPDTEYYDVGALVVNPQDAASLPATSMFFPDDRFYALDPDQASGWTYEVTTELRVTADLLGLTEEEMREQVTDERQQDALTRFPVHLWRLGDDRVLTYYDPFADRRFELHPRTEVSLQRVSQDDYLELVSSALEGRTDAIAAMRAAFTRDPAGWVLQDQLQLEIASSGGLRPRIDSLQKRDALAYARVETTLPDVQLEGSDEELREYYWSREWLLIGTDSDLYLVKLFVADDDHRTPDYGSVGAWLDAFRVLAM
jgi:hypothetical protein